MWSASTSDLLEAVYLADLNVSKPVSIGKTEIGFVIWLIQPRRQFAEHAADAAIGGCESVTNWSGA